MRTKFILSAILAVLFITANGAKVQAQNQKLQTAIVYQLTRLIDWCPNGKQGNFTIGLLGDDEVLLNELNSLQGRKVIEQPIVIKKISSVQESGTVNILFVARTRTADLPGVMSAIGSGCTLVVADKPGAANEGAAISLVEGNGKIQFEINKTYAQNHSLTMSNKLFELASKVY